MSNYRRLLVKGGTYFFTVVTYKRQPLLCEEHTLNRLKAAFRYVMKIMHPDMKQVIPLMPEEIRNTDGATKQDCEMNAGKR